MRRQGCSGRVGSACMVLYATVGACPPTAQKPVRRTRGESHICHHYCIPRRSCRTCTGGRGVLSILAAGCQGGRHGRCNQAMRICKSIHSLCTVLTVRTRTFEIVFTNAGCCQITIRDVHETHSCNNSCLALWHAHPSPSSRLPVASVSSRRLGPPSQWEST